MCINAYPELIRTPYPEPYPENFRSLIRTPYPEPYPAAQDLTRADFRRLGRREKETQISKKQGEGREAYPGVIRAPCVDKPWPGFQTRRWARSRNGSPLEPKPYPALSASDRCRKGSYLALSVFFLAGILRVQNSSRILLFSTEKKKTAQKKTDKAG